MTLDAGLNKTTSTDHRGWLWVTTILSIIYTVSVLVARLFGKYGLLWYDDATMGLAYCIAIARWGILMQAAEHGLGADLAAANLPMNTHNIALTARSVVVCILDTLSEIAIVAVPVLLLSKLQMQETKKRMVYTVFAARIGVVVFGISQAVAYNHFLKHHNRASIGLLPTLSLQELWLMYSFISATIPCMRSFLGAFGSPRLAVISPGNTKQSGYGSQGTALSTLKRRFSGEKGREASARVSSKANFRPDGPFYGVDIRHEEREGAGDDNSLASDGSEQMIIRRDTQIHIEREAISVDGNDDTGHHVGHAR
ncbi:hypothetical protein LTR97_001018 [Elasticomyces elasticus]|uniref:Rhodopsin domain-containing protein n=1 Tax=Elasticomyces elasticus TaxID=574655 RepID=A0AAN7WGQ5_9PEZI|nr:hypothetical protein LTR97_001018 [Elasticomyces elasticus]